MDWNNFTPIAAALGGALIGAASLMLLLFNGRTAGVSGAFLELAEVIQA